MKRSFLLIAIGILLLCSACSNNPVTPTLDTDLATGSTVDTINGPTDCYRITDSGGYWINCDSIK
ncbi:hypothetical protein LCGC14_1646100 [marine sediment metagenome]|uniref:Uncharacterized protein n=1 Tax=marine sediment metagenome TaxID=412755 RepID=A0A0F9KE14_9ZZZZ